MTAKSRYATVFLGAGAEMQCGVGQFARRLGETIEKSSPGSTTTLTLSRDDGTLAEIWQAIGTAETIVCNFPIVAWKRVILLPLMALAFARLRGRRVILLQHEWAGLHLIRRISYIPALLLADCIVMFSPLVRQELADDPVVGWAAGKCVLAPLPPNIEAPAGFGDSRLHRRLAAARAAGRLVVGHFGSIYPGKQPTALLSIGAVLKARGFNPLIVYIGSFIHGRDTVEQDFNARVEELGLKEDVIVSGYVGSVHDVFGLLSEVDAFCYPLDEGLTARRSSILACVQSGRPIIVTAPARADEFDHHPRFDHLIEHGAIVLVPRGADDDAYADAILAARSRHLVTEAFDFDGWWQDVARAVQAQLAVTPAAETAPDNAIRTPPAGT